MRVICAPDSFKGTLGAGAVAAAMADGLRVLDAIEGIDACPIADGGEGTLDALCAATPSFITRSRTVPGPLGAPVDARYLVRDTCLNRLGDSSRNCPNTRSNTLGDSSGNCPNTCSNTLGDSSGNCPKPGFDAVVELAQASGLTLLTPDAHDVMQASTRGTGHLIVAALEDGATDLLLTVGGSATVDGGAGILQALGAAFRRADGSVITEPLCPARLAETARIDPPPHRDLRLRIACDVTNPLLGPNGAAHTYGPQKGASPGDVARLDAILAHFATLIGGDPEAPGAGAAGGVPFGLATMLGATIERGIDLVLDALDFDARIADADLVITGEGRIDGQSMHGKAIMGVAARAAAAGVPTLAIAGVLGDDFDVCLGPGRLTDALSLSELYGPEAALADPSPLITDAVRTWVREWAERY